MEDVYTAIMRHNRGYYVPWWYEKDEVPFRPKFIGGIASFDEEREEDDMAKKGKKKGKKNKKGGK